MVTAIEKPVNRSDDTNRACGGRKAEGWKRQTQPSYSQNTEARPHRGMYGVPWVDQSSTAGRQPQRSGLRVLPRRGGQSAGGGEAPASNRGAEAGPMAQRHAEELRKDG